MVSLRRLFSIAASLVLVAGVASAAADTIGCTNTSGSTTVLRAEGMTELLAPMTFACVTPAGNVSLAPATPFTLQLFTTGALITSKDGGTAATQEATVTVVSTAINGVALAVTTHSTGTVSGNSVTWSALGLYASKSSAYTVTISGIRVDASTIPTASAIGVTMLAASSNANVASSIFTPAAGTPAVGTTPILQLTNVAIALKSLTTSVAPAVSASFGSVDSTGKIIKLTNCAMKTDFDPSKSNAVDAKQVANTLANVTFDSALSQALTVGQRVTFTVSNVPAGVTLYVPNTVTSGTVAAGNVVTAKIVVAYDANLSAGYLFDVTGTTDLYTKLPASGTVVYQITASPATIASDLIVPIIAQVDNPVAAAAPIAIAAGYAPTGTTTPLAIPRFIAPSSITSNLIAISPCTTTLFFPYVVVGGGYDTGLAVSNSGPDVTDPTSALDGKCTFTFHGVGAPTTTTPLAVKAGQTNAFDLLTAYPTGSFSGYAVAACDFQSADGYTFVVNAKGSTASYLPESK